MCSGRSSRREQTGGPCGSHEWHDIAFPERHFSLGLRSKFETDVVRSRKATRTRSPCPISGYTRPASESQVKCECVYFETQKNLGGQIWRAKMAYSTLRFYSIVKHLHICHINKKILVIKVFINLRVLMSHLYSKVFLNFVLVANYSYDYWCGWENSSTPE